MLFAEYTSEEYVDGSRVAVCLTQASNVWTISFFLMNISVFFLLPLMVLIILYTIIAKKLIVNDMSLAKMRPNKPELSYKARKQVILMLGAVVMAFFTCLLPFRVLTLWIIIAPHEYMEALGVEAYYNLLYFCRIMLYLNSAINPILYNLMSSKFRKGFKKLFYCYCLLPLCHRKQAKLKMLKRHHQNSHTTSSNTHTTSLTLNSRKNSSKMNASLNEETKILTAGTSVHHVELNFCAVGVRANRSADVDGNSGTEHGIDEDDVSDANNVEYELQLRMIDRKCALLTARDLQRAPFVRQISSPADYHCWDKKTRPCCSNGSAVTEGKLRHHHRHTIHLNHMDLGSATDRCHFPVVMNKKRMRKHQQRLQAELEKTRTSVTNNIPGQGPANGVADDTKRQEKTNDI